MRQIVETIEADVQSRPSAIEFEMAYQARVAIDRIRFAVRQRGTVRKALRHNARRRACNCSTRSNALKR